MLTDSTYNMFLSIVSQVERFVIFALFNFFYSVFLFFPLFFSGFYFISKKSMNSIKVGFIKFAVEKM